MLNRLMGIALLLLLSISSSAQYTVTGTVFHDPDGGFVNNSSGTANRVPEGIYAYLFNDGNRKIAAVVPVATDGTYTILTGSPGTYSMLISTTVVAVGVRVPGTTLPAGWVVTGEFIGPPNTGEDGFVSGNVAGVYVSSVRPVLNNVNFAIEQIPQTDAKSFSVSNAAFGKGAGPGGFPAVSVAGIPYHWIRMDNAALTGYTTGGSLSGSDPEDCAAASSCNINRKFRINTLRENTVLYYDFGGATGIRSVAAGTVIDNLDPAKFLIYGANGTGSVAALVGFTYTLIDAAGKSGNTATYNLVTPVPLPLELQSFHARLSDCSYEFSWTTANETDISDIVLEQGTAAGNFTVAATVQPKGPNSSYQLRIPAGNNHFFRLAIKGYDGSGSYSNTVYLKNDCAAAPVEVFPNPATDKLLITRGAMPEPGSYQLWALSGQLVLNGSLSAGTTEINVSALANGIYVLKILDGGTLSIRQVQVVR